MARTESLDAIELYEPGDRPRAATLNALIEACRYAVPPEPGAAARSRWPLQFRNDSGFEIPAHGVMQVSSAISLGGRPAAGVVRPSSKLMRLYLVNGPQPVPASAPGWCTTLDDADLVLVQSGGGTASSEWGVTKDQFHLSVNRYGFIPVAGTLSMGSRVYGVFRQHVVDDVLCKCSAATAESPWDVDSRKTVEVWSRDFEGATGLVIDEVMNYTTPVKSPDDKLSLTWFAGGPVAARLKC